jgi:hypothetical protein
MLPSVVYEGLVASDAVSTEMLVPPVAVVTVTLAFATPTKTRKPVAARTSVITAPSARRLDPRPLTAFAARRVNASPQPQFDLLA